MTTRLRRFLMAVLCTAGLACKGSSLPQNTRDAGTGTGGAAIAGTGGATGSLGGQSGSGTGGATGGLGGQSAPGTGGGSGGTPADPTDGWQVFRTNDKLDLLFMIDNSQSMEPLQDKLLANFPVFMNILKALPEGLPDIHVAVISSDSGPGEYDLPQIHCSYLGDEGLFQSAPRGSCAVSPLPAGQTFLQASNNQAQKNYTGDITDAFTCIAALGQSGCGFEGQLKSVRWALEPGGGGDSPAGTGAANAGFLRSDAYLAVVLLTNEDDCSVPNDSDLFDPNQVLISDPYGPLWSFRCNEFGHLCEINGSLQHPVRGVNTDLTGCVSNDTSTGKETRVADEIAFLKGLKTDPNQILVAAITGPVTPYSTDLINQTLPDGSMQMQPNTLHSCMENSGEFADPAIRIQQWVQGFGNNGIFLPICADSFAPALTQIADAVTTTMGPTCVTGPFTINATTGQPDCRVVDRDSSTGMRVDTVIGNCTRVMTGQTCWTMSDNAGACCSGKQLIVTRTTSALPSQGTAVTCQPCPAGQSEIGCP